MRLVNLIDDAGHFVSTQFLPEGISYGNAVDLAVPSQGLQDGKVWRWTGEQWEQAEDPKLNPVEESKIYTQAEWIRKNGFTGFKILSATKLDPLAQYFHEVLKAEDVVSTADGRLAIAYGYYVGAGYITQEEADEICGFSVEPLTAEQVQDRISGVA